MAGGRAQGIEVEILFRTGNRAKKIGTESPVFRPPVSNLRIGYLGGLKIAPGFITFAGKKV